MIKTKGFSCGWTGSSSGHVAGATGQKGKGRAASCRSYTIKVKRESDGRELTETIGPGYHPKKHWQHEQDQAQLRLLWRLGWKGQCCPKDTDKDGNCPRHSSPGTLRHRR